MNDNTVNDQNILESKIKEAIEKRYRFKSYYILDNVSKNEILECGIFIEKIPAQDANLQSATMVIHYEQHKVFEAYLTPPRGIRIVEYQPGYWECLIDALYSVACSEKNARKELDHILTARVEQSAHV